jgi:hypothetical protein
MSVNSACFHVTMVKDMLKTPVNDDEALAIMGLLHLCPIEVSAGTLSDAPDVKLLEPITQRHAAQCLASLWRDTTAERSQPSFWYNLWNENEMPETVEELSAAYLQKLEHMAKILERHVTKPRFLLVTP